MKVNISILLIVFLPVLAFGQVKLAMADYRGDFNYFWNSINDEYSYFDKKQTDWIKVKAIYSKAVDTVSTRAGFVFILEKTLNELYDHHANLNTNTPFSFRLVPSGTDVWAEYINGKPIITELRKGFGPDLSGVKPGIEIISINDIPVETSIQIVLPVSLKKTDIESYNYCLRMILAGNHVADRKWTLKYKGKSVDYYPDRNGKMLENINHTSKADSKLIGNIGYIKINDCLYDTDLVPVFDSVMASLQKSSALIIDLRETASGGNTVVARAILSWFTNKEYFYQKHEYPADSVFHGVKRSWLEIVSPRRGKYYSKPMVILCDHWTASLGEAIVIGFAAMKRPYTKIIGTEMARLKGAVYSYEMPNTKIRFSFPAERLFTAEGLPREKYLPEILIKPSRQPQMENKDVFVAGALDYLHEVLKTTKK